MITIIIPTYNEAQNIQKITEKIMSHQSHDTKILIIDDNSPDGTGQIAENLQSEYPGTISVN